MNEDATNKYNYLSAGFDPFLTRSIDNGYLNLDQASAVLVTREVNYDQSQTTGSIGSSLQIGKIGVDGVKGRISITDETGSEVLRLGELDG